MVKRKRHSSELKARVALAAIREELTLGELEAVADVVLPDIGEIEGRLR